MKWSHRDKDDNNDDFTEMATANESGNEVTFRPKRSWYSGKGFETQKERIWIKWNFILEKRFILLSETFVVPTVLSPYYFE